jgi:hypothetical protein
MGKGAGRGLTPQSQNDGHGLSFADPEGDEVVLFRGVPQKQDGPAAFLVHSNPGHDKLSHFFTSGREKAPAFPQRTHDKTRGEVGPGS